MKRFLMISLAVLLFSTAASAQTDSYLCLFSDVDHTEWCANAATIPGSFTMYIYLLPEAGGAFGAEFMLVYPDDPDIMTTLETYNTDITIIMGGLGTGAGVGFNGCKNDWFLIASQPIITMSAVQAIVAIAPHPTSGGPSYADCGPLLGILRGTGRLLYGAEQKRGIDRLGDVAVHAALKAALPVVIADMCSHRYDRDVPTAATLTNPQGS